MYANGRAIDPAFTPEEFLYMRCRESYFEDDGSMKPAMVHFPDQSVNRQRYSRPVDVLLPSEDESTQSWIHWGVVAIRVDDVPTSITSSGNVTYDFTVEHDPVEDNYGHTELRVYKDRERLSPKKKPNELVKKKYRLDLAMKMKMVVKPLI